MCWGDEINLRRALTLILYVSGGQLSQESQSNNVMGTRGRDDMGVVPIHPTACPLLLIRIPKVSSVAKTFLCICTFGINTKTHTLHK